jgi:endonuclease-3 related protein
MVGAILTQSAAWVNVEKAIHNLKNAGMLSPRALRRLNLNELATLIRPCGYFNAKARKLKALAEWLGQTCGDDPAKLSTTSLKQLRPRLLAVHGIGEETADSIILYAANKPIFVVDAYTRRIIDHLGLAPDINSYSAYQSFFMDNLPHRTVLFNEYHALLVQHGKQVCRKHPLCPECCLKDICRYGQDTLK